MPDEASLKALHRTDTASLLAVPGEYRDCPVQIAGDDIVFYQPPLFEVRQLGSKSGDGFP